VLLCIAQAGVDEHKTAAAHAIAQVYNLKDEVAAAREVIQNYRCKAKRQKRELKVRWRATRGNKTLMIPGIIRGFITSGATKLEGN
jgi:hypothetical protein